MGTDGIVHEFKKTILNLEQTNFNCSFKNESKIN